MFGFDEYQEQQKFLGKNLMQHGESDVKDKILMLKI